MVLPESRYVFCGGKPAGEPMLDIGDKVESILRLCGTPHREMILYRGGVTTQISTRFRRKDGHVLLTMQQTCPLLEDKEWYDMVKEEGYPDMYSPVNKRMIHYRQQMVYNDTAHEGVVNIFKYKPGKWEDFFIQEWLPFGGAR